MNYIIYMIKPSLKNRDMIYSLSLNSALRSLHITVGRDRNCKLQEFACLTWDCRTIGIRCKNIVHDDESH